jgi:hypothetical protein
MRHRLVSPMSLNVQVTVKALVNNALAHSSEPKSPPSGKQGGSGRSWELKTPHATAVRGAPDKKSLALIGMTKKEGFNNSSRGVRRRLLVCPRPCGPR